MKVFQAPFNDALEAKNFSDLIDILISELQNDFFVPVFANEVTLDEIIDHNKAKTIVSDIDFYKYNLDMMHLFSREVLDRSETLLNNELQKFKQPNTLYKHLKKLEGKVIGAWNYYTISNSNHFLKNIAFKILINGTFQPIPLERLNVNGDMFNKINTLIATRQSLFNDILSRIDNHLTPYIREAIQKDNYKWEGKNGRLEITELLIALIASGEVVPPPGKTEKDFIVSFLNLFGYSASNYGKDESTICKRTRQIDVFLKKLSENLIRKVGIEQSRSKKIGKYQKRKS